MPNNDEIKLNPNDFEDVDEELEDGNSNEEPTDKQEQKEENNSNSKNTEDNQAEDDNKVDEEEEKKKQQAERNRLFAEKRRKEEADERKRKELEEVRKQAKIEAELGILKKNTYTGKPIKDEEDLKIFKIQQELEEKGLDPINDLPERLAEVNRERIKLENEEREKANKTAKSIKDGVVNLKKAHPEINFSELSKDADFLDFANEKLNRGMDLVDIYDFYIALGKNKGNQAKQEEVKKKAVNEVTSTPSSNKNNSGRKEKSLDDIDSLEDYQAYLLKKYGSL